VALCGCNICLPAWLGAVACRVQQAEAAAAAAKRSKEAAALKEAGAVREVKNMQQRVRVLEESTRASQQAVQQAMHAAEPSKLCSELALSRQEVAHFKNS
jgi:hypothetical protein